MLHEFVRKNNPNAIRSWELRGCDACRRKSNVTYFFIIKNEIVSQDGYVSGGYICPDCGFSNAGRIAVDLLLK